MAEPVEPEAHVIWLSDRPLAVLADNRPTTYCCVTVTQQPRTKRCKWCGVAFAIGGRTGRPPEYCRRSHRQRHYEAKRLGQGRGLSQTELLITVDDYERLRDAVYVLETALEDVIEDLRGAPTRAEYAAAVAYLRSAATEVVETVPEPTAIGD